jgi:hypothetical protein
MSYGPKRNAKHSKWTDHIVAGFKGDPDERRAYLQQKADQRADQAAAEERKRREMEAKKKQYYNE